MSTMMEDRGLADLTAEERLELIGELWDSMADPPVPDWHLRELRRRIAETDAQPERLIPWDEVKARLNAKR